MSVGATDALELVLRTGCEVTLRGWLLLSTAGAAEFARMLFDYRTRERRLAADAGMEFVDLPPFLATAAQTDKPPRNLFAIAEALDRHDHLDIKDPASARRWYRSCYRWPSVSSAHAGLQSLKRYTSEQAGRLHVVTAEPLRMSSHPEVFFAGLVGALADDVFDDFGIERFHLDALGVRIKPRTV